jgi:hypothetical protein
VSDLTFIQSEDVPSPVAEFDSDEAVDESANGYAIKPN